MNLKIKDKRILAELDLNARATFQEIGRKARLSKETVIYRVKNLEKRDIIQRYTTLVNFAKLGYTGYGLYSRFQNIDEDKKEKIINSLKKIPEVYWIALIGGKFDLACGIMCKNVFQFNKIHYQILTEHGKYLTDNTIAIRTELRQHKRKYLLNEKSIHPDAPFFGKAPEIEKLDNLDSNILSLLSNKARISIVDLASLVKKPISTVALRIKQLEKKSIIQGYSAYIKARNYGMQSYRLLLHLDNINEAARNKLFSYVSTNQKMILAIETLGQWNFEITLEVESQEELQKEISLLYSEFPGTMKNIEFIIMFEDDLVYDPYPLKKKEREELLKNYN